MAPLFLLPDVVLFPGVSLPLHIFESRYREMARDALAGEQTVGMVLLRAGGEAGGADNPPTPPAAPDASPTASNLRTGAITSCCAACTSSASCEEDRSRSYRRAHVETAPEPGGMREGQRCVERLLAGAGSNLQAPAGMGDANLVNALSQYLEFDPLEKQALLERDGPAERWAICWRCTPWPPPAASGPPRRSSRPAG